MSSGRIDSGSREYWPGWAGVGLIARGLWLTGLTASRLQGSHFRVARICLAGGGSPLNGYAKNARTDANNAHKVDGKHAVPSGASVNDGLLQVPAGDTAVFKATFVWPFSDDPGQFVQFALQRLAGDAADTCTGVVVYGAQIRY